MARTSPAPAVDRLGIPRMVWANTPVSIAGATSCANLKFQAALPCSSARSPNRTAVTGSRGKRSS